MNDLLLLLRRRGLNKMTSPRNELELITLFAQKCVNNPNIEIISIDGFFPDAVIRWGDREYKVEFEYKAYNFWIHGHNPTECDLVICWENDDNCPVLPIIALSDSEWENCEIKLTKNIEKTASYWKNRALEAEKNLEELSIQKEVIQKESYLKKYTNEDARFIELVSEGLTKSEACWRSYKRSFSGTFSQRLNRLITSSLLVDTDDSEEESEK